MIKAIATASFVHGSQSLKRGEEADFSLPTFTALAAHGLVSEKPEQTEASPARAQRAARTPSNKKAPDLQNKALPDAAPAAPAMESSAAAPEPGGADPADPVDPAPADTGDAHQS